MPFTEEGIKPDLIVNPHALPSRMTIGQLVETLMGKACVSYGAFGDCTAFSNKGPKHKIFGNLLTEIGYNSTGNELLYNGQTGQQMETQIFIGPTYYMRLKHMVKDKINYRSQGPRTVLTRQTVLVAQMMVVFVLEKMERDGIIAHGAAKFLEESLMKRGDEYYMAVCNKSGTIAVYNETLNLFLSPMVDGPIKFNESLEGTMNIENVSKFGRSFSIVRIPYALKLLMQELLTMNVQMRIITEDNVEQLTNLSFSNNVDKLMSVSNITAQEIIRINSESLRKSKDEQVDNDEVKPSYTAAPPPDPPAPSSAVFQSEAPPGSIVYPTSFDDPFATPPAADPQSDVQKPDVFATPQPQAVDIPIPSTTPSYAVESSQASPAAVSPSTPVVTSPQYTTQVSPQAVMMPVVQTMFVISVPQMPVSVAPASPPQTIQTQRTPAEEEMRLKEVLSSNEPEEEDEKVRQRRTMIHLQEAKKLLLKNYKIEINNYHIFIY